ncbi:hypothetical protein DV515_00013103, partial [Chloebia gouldiae]
VPIPVPIPARFLPTPHARIVPSLPSPFINQGGSTPSELCAPIGSREPGSTQSERSSPGVKCPRCVWDAGGSTSPTLNSRLEPKQDPERSPREKKGGLGEQSGAN